MCITIRKPVQQAHERAFVIVSTAFWPIQEVYEVSFFTLSVAVLADLASLRSYRLLLYALL